MRSRERTDVLVVGAGAAGLSAASEAVRRGAEVLVVDADRDLGGTARFAGGGVCIAGSPLQAQLGIKDDPATAFADWVAWGGHDVDQSWAWRYLVASVPDVFERLSSLGLQWRGVLQEEGNRVPRWHAPEGGGRAVIHALATTVRDESKLRWRFEHRLSQLCFEGGRVSGAVVIGPAGPVEITASSTLIATGGFCSEPDWIRSVTDNMPASLEILAGGGPNARGQGHDLLLAAGADSRNLDAVWMYAFATPDPDRPGRGLAVRGLEGDLWVTGDGHRFHDESRRGGATATPALLSLPDARCWSIADARGVVGLSIADPAYRRGDGQDQARIERLISSSSAIVRSNALPDLAETIGVEPQTLRDTVDRYNGWMRADYRDDPDFGRPLHGLAPIDHPPFYAIRFQPLARKNLGGVRTDADCRVLRRDGSAIEGLYAAGEVAGMAGGAINGRAALEGTMLGPSLFSGQVAGRRMTT